MFAQYWRRIGISILVLLLTSLMLYAGYLYNEELKESDMISMPRGQRAFLIFKELKVSLPESSDLNSVICSVKDEIDALVRAEFPSAHFQGIGVTALSIEDNISISKIDLAFITRNVPKYTQYPDKRADLHYVAIWVPVSIVEGKASIEHLDCRTMGEDYFRKAAKDDDICKLKFGWFDAVNIVRNNMNNRSLGEIRVYKTSDKVKYFDGRPVWALRCVEDSDLYWIDANSGEILEIRHTGWQPKVENIELESGTIEDVTEDHATP